MDKINPYDKAHELARSIISSDAYLNYIAAKKKIEKDPEIKEKIQNLRIRQLEINKANLLGEEVSRDQINAVTLEFAQLSQNREIAEFFEAESRFVQMFSDLNEIIQKAVESGFEE
ncbi:MAG: YlbF family regulator [Syntrophomonadaceae bacterium]|nr:YlbF family regulator [Syntrophomonadaceae bacterium]